MDGTEDARAHRAEEPLGMQEAAVHTLSIPHVGIFRLLGEGVLLQPRQQFQIHSHPLVMYLRGVDVHIVHRRNEQAVAEVGHLGALAVQC